MSEMKVYIANLGKYNEGELVGEWFDLPVDMDEVYEIVFEPHELDKNGQPLGDYAIHDYELPFEISEHESIQNLNEVAEYLQEFDSVEPILSGDYDIEDVINFAHELGKEEHVQNIVDDESLDQFVKHELEESGWQRVGYMLRNVNDMSEDHYLINGYGNVENVSVGHEKMIVKDVLDEVRGDFLRQKKARSVNRNDEFGIER